MSMKYFHILFIFSLMLFVAPQSFAKTEGLKICASGLDKCKDVIDDAQKYSTCMKAECAQYYNQTPAKKQKLTLQDYDSGHQKKSTQEIVHPCEYGLRKCDVLSDKPEFYWECINDSCKVPNFVGSPACELGQNMCTDLQKMYNQCMKFSCGDESATETSCPDSKLNCGENLRSYWHCVYEICLGPVDQYMKHADTEKIIIVTDEKGHKKPVKISKPAPEISGAPVSVSKAPKNVDPEEWIRTTPEKFLLKSSPAQSMRCLIPTAILDCQMDDIRSCRCSDGSAPILINGVPTRDYKD